MERSIKTLCFAFFCLAVSSCNERPKEEEPTTIPERNAYLIELVKRGDFDRVRKIIDRDKTLARIRRPIGDVPLICFAAVNGHVKIVNYLLDMGADVNASADSGIPPLHRAVDQGDLAMVRTLLRHKADVNARNKCKQTPLHYTLIDKSPEIVELLISVGADVSVKDDQGRTPLHRCKKVYVARSLVSAGTDVNAKDDMGRTAIHLAALPREIVDKSTITYLLSQGADINTKDIEGLTPYELAKKNKKYTLILILDAYVIRR